MRSELRLPLDQVNRGHPRPVHCAPRTIGHLAEPANRSSCPMRVPLALLLPLLSLAAPAAPATPSLWDRENLAAWCIVPFDALKRSPVERAQMLRELGLTKLAYDFREEHVPAFADEIRATRAQGIEIVAWWFPTELDATARQILETVARHGLRPQLWVSGWDSEATRRLSHEERLRHEVDRIRRLATAAHRVGCRVGLYNHGGWFGEPEHQMQVIERLRAEGISHVGIVYNFHHGHDHIDRFPALWPRIQPHVMAVNLNGMVRGGDRIGRKIVPVGDGDAEADMMRIIEDSGWRGLVGILNHQEEVDARHGLARNLAGLARLTAPAPTPNAQD